ncbi:sulfite exporter TauE/SafE family protein [Roseovarius pelagicus]|uniref:Probable membrane transporter protein n=1 Tax=Roseovarius pelagicus TaxID=2980108 RepID=A0ABY6DHC2_9RHOB|nr:sulfite exporter TauE/SafE family protein [Roseovarius pelagicus]UXX84648.1 sulfite exporter TauE/SafE family protein [Roseovarius pelagicus]
MALEINTLLGLTPGVWLLAALAAIFAGISKGGFGSGAAFAGASMLAIALTPGQALGIMLPVLMLIDLATLRPYWRQWSWPDARLLVLGGMPGVALGAALYQVADADALRLLIGAICLLFVGWQLWGRLGTARRVRGEIPAWGGAVAGLVAGFTSFVSHAGGPPAAIYLLSRGLTKTEYQATTVLLFWMVNIAKAVPYGFLGIFTTQTLLIDIVLAPFALLGAWLGVIAHRAVPERAFFALTYVLLTATGAKLIWDALV